MGNRRLGKDLLRDVGQITFAVLRDLIARWRPTKAKIAPRGKARFTSDFNAERPAALRAEIFLFRFIRNHAILSASRLTERGVRAVVTICEAGMRWTCGLAVYLLHGRTSRCGREVVWS